MGKDNQIIHLLIDRLIESSDNIPRDEIQSPEAYKARMKLEAERVFTDYIESIQNGYEVILRRLQPKESKL